MNKVALLLSVLWAALPGYAQIGLPNIRVPQIPALGAATTPLTQTLDDAQRAAGNAAPTALRRLAARNLIRQNSRLLEADPNGEPMMRAQIVAFDLPADAVARLAAAGFTIVRQQSLDGIGAALAVFSAPPGTATRRALAQARASVPNGNFDYNHLYGTSAGVTGQLPQARPALPPNAPPPPSNPTPPLSNVNIRIGLIDGGIDTAHPVFAGSALNVWGCEGRRVPTAHGTAVASLLVGRAQQFASAAAGAALFAADVYCGVPIGGSIDAIAGALSWMSANRVPVINVSLVGPANLILEKLVRAMIERGHIIVAAVGNDGPAAPSLYPAAYPDVVGVTAVDARRRVLLEAGRGPQVKFAAPGADMAAASHPVPYAGVRGTSFAAPIVAAMLATQMPDLDADAAHAVIARLALSALDLGPRGVDPIYGYGLVGESWRVPLDIIQRTP